MAKQLFANNVSVTINEFLSATDTTITVSSTSRFPSLGTGDWIMATIVPQGGQGTPEIVKITAITGNNLTVTRGQEASSAQSFTYGALLELRVTKGSLEFLRDRPGVINVKTDHGAIGDGVTDDSAAINAASLAASQANVALYFPAGTYIGKNLEQYTNSEWIGDGVGSTIKLINGAGASDLLIANKDRGTNDNGSDAAGNNHIRMRDLQLDGNKANQTNAIPLIRWRVVKYGQITGCHIINGKGIAFDGCNGIDHCVISQNIFRNNVGRDIQILWVSNRCIISDNVIIGANLPVIDGGEAGSVTDDAIHIKATNFTGAADFNCAEFEIHNNIVKGKVQGLLLEGVFDAVVSENIFGSQTGNTIKTQASTTFFCQGIQLRGNVINQEAASSFVAFWLDGSRIKVQGNQILSNGGGVPIYVHTGSNNLDMEIGGNVCKFASLQDTNSCIRVRDASALLIHGNTLRNGRNGIHLDTPSSGVEMGAVSVLDNIMVSINRNPIRIENGGVGRNIKGVEIIGNTSAQFGAQTVNSHDGIFIEQSGGVIEDVHIGPNSFIDASTNPRDAIRFSGTITRMVVDPSQKVTGLNGVIVTGYYNAAPTDGPWFAGQRIYDFSPTAGGTEGFVCTVSGNPGTWKTFGTISV